MIYLLDGFHYIFRAYYAMRPLTNSKGIPTHASFGFVQMLFKIFKTAHPHYIAVFFDSKEPTFRKKLFSDYKANRETPPEDLSPQIEWIMRIVRDLDIPCLAKPGYEADDLIGTAARECVEAGFPVTIITGDKDFMQLVSPHVELWDTGRDLHIDRSGVEARFAVSPEQVIDLLALAGDSSDNVPGVRGVGEKTAAQLLQKYGSLDGIYAHLDEIPGRRGELLRESKEMAYLSKKLVTIDRHVPCEFSLAEFEFHAPHWDALSKTFAELEFSRLWKEAQGLFGGQVETLVPSQKISPSISSHSFQAAEAMRDAGKYRVIADFESLAHVVLALQKVKAFAIDTETTGLNPHRAELVGISLSWALGEAVYIPIAHSESSPQLSKEAVVHSLRPFLESSNWQKIGQNLKYDLHILRRAGFSSISGPFVDTMVAAYLLDPAGSHGLDALSRRYLGFEPLSYEAVTGKGKETRLFSEVPISLATAYAAEDAALALALFHVLDEQLKSSGLEDLFFEMEMPVLAILAQMEARGILLDVECLSVLSKEFERELRELETDIHREAGDTFNIQSPKQLAHILFDKMGFPVISKTKTGPSTASDVLDSLASRYDAKIARFLLRYRQLAKLKSTYVDRLPELVHPDTQRIHSSFNQTMTVTGRLSSSDPNLQNIPIRGEDGAAIREAFVAPPGFVLLSLDYSQIELRVLAELSGDPALRKTFAAGLDCHAETASRLFGVSASEASGDQRRIAKTINFATLYGQGAYSLAQQLHISQKEAKHYIEKYFSNYAKVGAYRESVLAKARENGYVETAWGHRRYLPELKSENTPVRVAAERMAFNTAIQGTAAEIVKRAMIAIAPILREAPDACRLLLQVHDELVFEVKKDQVEKYAALFKQFMEGAAPHFNVSLAVQFGYGKNWAEAH